MASRREFSIPEGRSPTKSSYSGSLNGLRLINGSRVMIHSPVAVHTDQSLNPVGRSLKSIWIPLISHSCVIRWDWDRDSLITGRQAVHKPKSTELEWIAEQTCEKYRKLNRWRSGWFVLLFLDVELRSEILDTRWAEMMEFVKSSPSIWQKHLTSLENCFVSFCPGSVDLLPKEQVSPKGQNVFVRVLYSRKGCGVDSRACCVLRIRRIVPHGPSRARHFHPKLVEIFLEGQPNSFALVSCQWYFTGKLRDCDLIIIDEMPLNSRIQTFRTIWGKHSLLNDDDSFFEIRK